MDTPFDPAPAPPPRFQLAAASVAGRDHQRVGRNNQDAWAVFQGRRALVAVVADGCGSAPHSEAGARLGARLLASALARRLEDGAGPVEAPVVAPIESLLDGARQEVLWQLRAVALGLCPSSGPDARLMLGQVRDHLLFTLLGAVVGPVETVAFALGDGLLEVDGRPLALGPFPGNEPPYLGYALLPEALHGVPEAALRLQIVARLPTASLRTLALGTDGACGLAAAGAPVAALFDDGLLFRNPDALRRRLFLLARDVPGAARPAPLASPPSLAPLAALASLHDDTTLVLIRRDAPSARDAV